MVDELEERVAFLLKATLPMHAVTDRRRGEYRVGDLGDVWVEEAPMLGYGVVKAQPHNRGVARFEFLLTDGASLQWAIAAACAHLEHPDEPLAEPSPTTRP